MIYEKSCGAVVFTRDGGTVKYVVIRNLSGYYGFPKGHVEAGETETETALREIYEEVGLRPTLIADFREVDEHPLPGKTAVTKQIVYFLAEYSGQEIRRQKSELLAAKLLTFDETMSVLKFDRIKEIFRKADAYIREVIEKVH